MVPERRRSLARAADLKDGNIFVGFEPESLEQHPRRHVRRAADAADADAFAFELLRRANGFMNNQLVGKRVDEAADGDERRAADHSIGDAPAGDICDFHRAGDQSGNVGGRRRDED
jgi:hypothetical protein